MDADIYVTRHLECNETLVEELHVRFRYLRTLINKLRYGSNYGRIRFKQCTFSSVSNEDHTFGIRMAYETRVYCLLLLLLNFITK
jgi:hypothetical protein